MPKMRQRPKLDRRAVFRRILPDTNEAAAQSAWFGGVDVEEFERWVAVRDFTGNELVSAGAEVSALRTRFVVRADSDTEGLEPRSHTLTDERGTWDIISSSRSQLRGAYLELLCVLRE